MPCVPLPDQMIIHRMSIQVRYGLILMWTLLYEQLAMLPAWSQSSAGLTRLQLHKPLMSDSTRAGLEHDHLWSASTLK